MAKSVKRKKKKVRKSKTRVPLIVRGVLIAFVVVFAISALTYYFYQKKKSAAKAFTNERFSQRGVDLSHHNPIINWTEVKEANTISFVYLKASGGIKHTDRNYIYNYESAHKANLRVGSYHFYLFGVSGREQAKHFINSSKVNTGDLYPVIDVEHSADNAYSPDTAYINLTVRELKILESELFEYFGVRPVIYTNKECYRLYVENYFPDNLIWMCSLGEEPTGINNWIIWQFSHKGELDGVVGNIDLNYFRYPANEFYKITMP